MTALARRKDGSPTGIVFNVQRYSLHDGEGIRTLVFLKGCTLRCRWCGNPESQRRKPEIARNVRRCLGIETCSYCTGVCTEGALRLPAAGAPAIDRNNCTACGACAAKCPALALHLYGTRRSASEVLDEVETDWPFYVRSGGGMTLSGGEPLAQEEFALALLREAKRRHIDAAVETCGLVPWETLAAAAELSGAIYFDIKAIDADRHIAWTGGNNRAILSNLERLADAFPRLAVTVRTPVIPGFNDDEAEIGAILSFLARLPSVSFELLPYHRLGSEKYRFLDRRDEMSDQALPTERFDALAAFAAERRRLTGRSSLNVHIAEKSSEIPAAPALLAEPGVAAGYIGALGGC